MTRRESTGLRGTWFVVVDLGFATVIGLDRRASQEVAEASMFVMAARHPGRQFVVRETDGLGLFPPGEGSPAAL